MSFSWMWSFWPFAASTPASTRRLRSANKVEDPDIIHDINRWRHGNRVLKAPKRLVDTPTQGHWPFFRSAVNGGKRSDQELHASGKERCPKCGKVILKKRRGSEGRIDSVTSGRIAKEKLVGRGKNAVVRKERGRPMSTVATRSLRGRVVEFLE